MQQVALSPHSLRLPKSNLSSGFSLGAFLLVQVGFLVSFRLKNLDP